MLRIHVPALIHLPLTYMTTLQQLPSFILPTLLQNLDFEDFANTFKVWMHRKDDEVKAHILSEFDLCKFFPSGQWKKQFEPFMNYACNLGVDDALFYIPAWHLAQQTGFKDDAFYVLKYLTDGGHLRSKFAYSFFRLLYTEEVDEENVSIISNLLQNPVTLVKVKEWFLQLHYLKCGWHAINHNHEKLPVICNQVDKGSNLHLNSSSWIHSFNDIDDIACIRCKIVLLLLDYCKNQYN